MNTSNYKYLNILFVGLSIIFPVFITAKTVFNLPQILFFVTTALLLGYVLVATYFDSQIQVSTSVYLITFYIICFAIINVSYALDPSDARAKWIIWIFTLFILLRLTNQVDYQNIYMFLRKIPVVLFITTFMAVILTIDEYGVATSRNNSIGMYAGAMFVSAFYLKGFSRFVLLLFGAIAIYGTSSRAAMLGTAVAVLPILLYTMRLARFYLYLIPIFFVLIYFSPEIENITSEFFNRKALSGSALQSLMHSQEQREYLFEVGLYLASLKPYLGYGLGDGYIDLVVLNDGAKTVHNGYLTTVIEVGVPFSIIIFLTIMVSFTRLLFDRFIDQDYKVVTLCFMFYILIRAYGENYLIFNSANNVSLIFMALVLIFLFNKTRRMINYETESG